MTCNFCPRWGWGVGRLMMKFLRVSTLKEAVELDHAHYAC